MRTLYPDIKPFDRQMLDVGDGHRLYIDQSGRQDAHPVLFLHGGPGNGCEFDSRRFFDPNQYRIVLLDQRGSGRSEPLGETRANTLDDLIRDIESIRVHLGLERWALFGGGWGSTLALSYAQTFPEHVSGMILRSPFLGRKQDIEWIYGAGLNRFYPDQWREFCAPLEDGVDPIQGYQALMGAQNELGRMDAAKRFAAWEAECSNLRPDARLVQHLTKAPRALSRCRIGTHYYVNDCFLAPNQLLDDAHRLTGIPGYIVQGRFDLVTPPEAALALAQAWPGSELFMVREAGHSATEPTMIDALVRSTEGLADRLNAG
jgi:proline iminopeptidase